ncbi:MAG: polysaccharide deacetylase family protein [Oscillospiraceae bacterium]|nr:polysaccharide deacetylase family protein [Oscillospiraceae bacterium]
MKILIALLMVILVTLFTGCDEYPQYFPTTAEESRTTQPLLPPPEAEMPTETNLAHNDAEYIPDNHETEVECAEDDIEYEPGNSEPESWLNPEIDMRDRPMIALTFDDGPSRFTDYILNILEQYNARATFFVLGYRVEARQDTVLRTVNIGSEVAGHTWSHRNLSALSCQAIAETIQNTSAIIDEVTGISPRFFRPPYGWLNSNVANISGELGYSVVNWTLDPMDWKYRDAQTIYNNIMNRVEEGAIILLHDIHPTTVAAMELVIPSLIAEGYQLVTVSELLYHLYGELEPGKLYGTPGKMN